MPPAGPSLSSGLQDLLHRAAGDEALRRDLLDRRDAAADAAGFALTANERAVLRAVPAAQLTQLLPPVPAGGGRLERREFLREAGSAAVVLLGGAALGGAALAPATAECTPDRPSPPTGIRPDLPWFEGELDVVRYRTLTGPARPLPDVDIERRLVRDGVRQVPPQFAGTLGFQLRLDPSGRVTDVKPADTVLVDRRALQEMGVVLQRVKFHSTFKATTLAFDVVFTPRRRVASRPWAGRVELADVDAAGSGADAVRQVVRGLGPRFLERLAPGALPDRPKAGKLRYAFRTDVEGRPGEVELTKNTAVHHMLAMALRSIVTDAKFPKATANTWCRFSVVLPPA